MESKMNNKEKPDLSFWFTKEHIDKVINGLLSQKERCDTDPEFSEKVIQDFFNNDGRTIEDFKKILDSNIEEQRKLLVKHYQEN